MATKSKAGKDVVETVEEKEVVLSHSARQESVGAVTTLEELRQIFGAERDWADIEPSFVVMQQEVFEDKPVVIGAFRFNQSNKYMRKNAEGFLIPGEFTSMLIAQYDPETEELVPVAARKSGESVYWVIVNDGGTGINKQLERYAKEYDEDVNVGCRKAPPLRVENGLRRSNYDYDTGETVIKATTWYLS